MRVVGCGTAVLLLYVSDLRDPIRACPCGCCSLSCRALLDFGRQRSQTREASDQGCLVKNWSKTLLSFSCCTETRAAATASTGDSKEMRYGYPVFWNGSRESMRTAYTGGSREVGVGISL